jgi:hypothetical protein
VRFEQRLLRGGGRVHQVVVEADLDTGVVVDLPASAHVDRIVDAVGGALVLG